MHDHNRPHHPEQNLADFGLEDLDLRNIKRDLQEGAIS